jgi:tRNA(fMet)-specific endonuclease VapC
VNYLLDTNICIYIIKTRPRAVLATFEAHDVGEIGLSSITAAELHYGVAKSQYPRRNQDALEQFLAPLVIADFDVAAAEHYGRIRAALERRGTPIGPLDTLIAAQALSLDVILVTNNVREFSGIPALRVENWAQGA